MYDFKGIFMARMMMFSSRRYESKSKQKKTSIGNKASRGKMNKDSARSYKKYRGQGR